MTEASAGGTRGRRKQRVGRVVSDAMDKTVVVAVERRYRHPLLGKVVRRFTRLHVHDPENRARVGDEVRVVETRPMSRLKRWRLLEVVRSAAAPAGETAS